MPNIGHYSGVRADPRTTSNGDRFLRRITLQLDRNVEPIDIVVVLARKQNDMLTDQYVILNNYIVQVSPDTDPDIITKGRSYVVNYNAVEKHNVLPDIW